MRKHIFPYWLIDQVYDNDIDPWYYISLQEVWDNIDDMSPYYQDLWLRSFYPLKPGIHIIQTLTSILGTLICFVYLAITGTSIYRDTYKEAAINSGYAIAYLIPFSSLNYILRI